MRLIHIVAAATAERS